MTAIDNLSTGRIENIAHLLENPDFNFVRASIMDELVMDRLTSQSAVVVHQLRDALQLSVGGRISVEQHLHLLARR